MRCHSCDFELPAGAQFCPACGTKQRKSRSKKVLAEQEQALALALAAPLTQDQTACAQCGVGLGPGSHFCYSCGTPQDDVTPLEPESVPAAPAAPPTDMDAMLQLMNSKLDALEQAVAATQPEVPEPAPIETTPTTAGVSSPEPDIPSPSDIEAMLDLMRSKAGVVETPATPAEAAPVASERFDDIDALFAQAEKIAGTAPEPLPPATEPPPAVAVSAPDPVAAPPTPRLADAVPQPVVAPVAASALQTVAADIDDLFAQAQGVSSPPEVEVSADELEALFAPPPPPPVPPPAADDIDALFAQASAEPAPVAAPAPVVPPVADDVDALFAAAAPAPVAAAAPAKPSAAQADDWFNEVANLPIARVEPPAPTAAAQDIDDLFDQAVVAAPAPPEPVPPPKVAAAGPDDWFEQAANLPIADTAPPAPVVQAAPEPDDSQEVVVDSDELPPESQARTVPVEAVAPVTAATEEPVVPAASETAPTEVPPVVVPAVAPIELDSDGVRPRKETVSVAKLADAPAPRRPVPEGPSKKWLYAGAGALGAVALTIAGLGYWGWGQSRLAKQQAEQLAQQEQAMLARLAAEAQRKQAEEEAQFAEQQARAEREAEDAKKNEAVLAAKIKEAEERAVNEYKNQKGRTATVARAANGTGTGTGTAVAATGGRAAGGNGAPPLLGPDGKPVVAMAGPGAETAKQKAEREAALKLRQARAGARADDSSEELLFTDNGAGPMGMTSRAELRRAEVNRQPTVRAEATRRELPSLLGNLQLRLQFASESPERLLERAKQCKSAAECAMVMLAGAGLSSDEVVQTALAKAAGFNRTPVGDRGSALDFENQGLAEYRAGNYARSVEWLEQAVAADPSSPVARTSLASSLLRSSQLERGAYVLESSLALDPARTATWIEMAHYFALRGDGSSAVNAMTVAYKLWPNKRLAKAYFRSQSSTDDRSELRPLYQAALRSVEVIPLRGK